MIEMGITNDTSTQIKKFKNYRDSNRAALGASSGVLQDTQ
jgi:hypothetical protein